MRRMQGVVQNRTRKHITLVRASSRLGRRVGRHCSRTRTGQFPFVPYASHRAPVLVFETPSEAGFFPRRTFVVVVVELVKIDNLPPEVGK